MTTVPNFSTMSRADVERIRDAATEHLNAEPFAIDDAVICLGTDSNSWGHGIAAGTAVRIIGSDYRLDGSYEVVTPTGETPWIDHRDLAYGIDLDPTTEEPQALAAWERELLSAPAPKVPGVFAPGDRVAYTGSTSPSMRGRTGTVEEVESRSNVLVRWDVPLRSGMTVWGCYPRSLSHVS